MSLRINQNIGALIANRNLRVTNEARSKSLERLSSGLRINRASDDAAGLGISEKLRAQIRGLGQAQRNAQDGISLIQTAEGALTEVSGLLIRARELAVQAANDSITDADRANITSEVEEILEEIDRISESTEFNTKKLLVGGEGVNPATVDPAEDRYGNVIATSDAISAAVTASADVVDNEYEVIVSGTSGNFSITVEHDGGTYFVGDGFDDDHDFSFQGIEFSVTATAVDATVDDVAIFTSQRATTDAQEFKFHIGANADQTTTVGIEAMDTEALGIDSVNVGSVEGANEALGLLDSAISSVASQRSSLGAVQNRLEHTINNLEVASENLSASESRIRDVDMAHEMTNYTRNQIMLQAGTAMLAQANMSPQMVLQLLG